ncbi:MAG TPA: DNA repair protein RecO [Candidatus Coprovivens excrementavium]|nr:DNA repair protein RecO [Candidatus Coprovivens excrementavium]
MLEKYEGIIITETPYGDNSKIINVLTKERGLIGIMCNNVKNIKNPLRTKTLKFTYGYFHIKYHENKLSKLVDVDIINNLKNIRNDIELISYMSYITDLTYQVVKQNNDSQIYSIYISTVLKLNEQKNPLILTNILELKYLDYLGVGLNLTSCIKCGSTKNIVTLDPDEGGYICQNCYTNEKLLSPKSIKLIRMYYLIDINSISDINIKSQTANEINYFLDKYYERYTGVYLKSKDFLKKINSLTA